MRSRIWCATAPAWWTSRCAPPGCGTPESSRPTWPWWRWAAMGAANCTRARTSTSWCCCRKAIRPTGSRISNDSSRFCGTSAWRSATACARSTTVSAKALPTSAWRPRCSRRDCWPAPSRCSRACAARSPPIGSGRRRIFSKPRSRSRPNVTTAISTRRTTSNRTSSRVRAAFATCRPSAGWRSGISGRTPSMSWWRTAF